MKRLQIRENEPPLRYFLEPRRGKVGKITDKIMSVTNSILSFVKEYYDDSKNNTSKYAGSGNLWEANLETMQKDNQANNRFNKTLENAAKTRASKFIRFQDIQSQQENQPQENQIMINKVQQRCPPLAENESRLDQKDEEKEDQQMNQGYINNQGLYNIQQNVQINQDQSEQQPHQFTESVELQGKKRNRELPHNNYNDKKSSQQYQVCLDSSDDEQIISQGQLPRKRVKLMYERQLGYINQLNQNKWKAQKETQQNIQKNMKRKSRVVSSNKVNTIQKIQQIQNQPIINLVQKLQTIEKRRNSMNRNITKSQYFTPIQNVIRPKKVNLNQQKIIQILRQPTLKPLKIVQIPIFKNTDQKIENKQTPLLLNNQNGTNVFTPSFNIPTLIPKTNLAQQQKPQVKQPEIDKGFSFSLFSNTIPPKKMPQDNESKQKKSQQILQKNAPIPKQDVNVIKQTENKQIIPNQQKQEIKQIKETKKAQKKPQTDQNKPEVKPLKQNPFTQKPSNNIRQLLPQLLVNSKPLFGKTEAGPSIFDNLFQKKEPKDQFSTPTKNIYQKYPEIKPNVSAPILESQEDESSMFDQSSFSTSKKQDPSPLKGNLSLFPGPGTSNIGSFLGSNNTFLSQSEGGFEKSQNFFFSNLPNVDANKSVQMFGRLSNDSSPDSLFVSPLGDQNKKISTNKNKKKTKQQRAYG